MREADASVTSLDSLMSLIFTGQALGAGGPVASLRGMTQHVSSRPLGHASPPVFIRSEPNFMINKVVMRNIKLKFMDVLALKLLWHFEFFCYHGTIWGCKFQNATPTVFIQPKLTKLYDE